MALDLWSVGGWAIPKLARIRQTSWPAGDRDAARVAITTSASAGRERERERGREQALSWQPRRLKAWGGIIKTCGAGNSPRRGNLVGGASATAYSRHRHLVVRKRHRLLDRLTMSLFGLFGGPDGSAAPTCEPFQLRPAQEGAPPPRALRAPRRRPPTPLGARAQ